MKKQKPKHGRRRSEKHAAQYEKKSGKKQGRPPSGRAGHGKSSSGKPHGRPQGKALTGRVQKNPRGFAFLIPQDRRQEDTFVTAEDARSLMSGDIVEYRVHREGRRTRGEILKIVKRQRKKLLGYLRHGIPDLYVATPDGDFDLEERTKLAPNQYVIARILHYPSGRRRGAVAIEEGLGSQLKPKHDYAVAVANFGLTDEFSERAIADAEEARKDGLKEIAHLPESRHDLRDLPFVTIDGEDAKDFDDAILVTPGKSGGFILYVAIADVAYFVQPGTALDNEALARGTSVYLPGFCIPMLPEILSNDQCSLRPREDRLSQVAEIHYDRTANVIDAKFYSAVICTAHRLTYKQVQEFFDAEKKDPALKNVRDALNLAYDLYERLLKKRAERGVLDFDLPETKLEVDKEGNPIGCKRAERWDSHKLIEEFMIAANSAVAKALRESSTGALYRVHETPDPTSLDEINLLMKSLGINNSIKDATPKDFARLLIATKGVKGAHTLHQAILRSQRQARYEPEPKGHFGLALMDYAHFTSPIRRYPDLVVHRALRQLTSKGKNTDKRRDDEAQFEALARLGDQTSDAERLAMEAERFTVKRKQCWFMKERLGEKYEGTISGVTANGLFVEIDEFGIDGFLPLDKLNGVYEYDENRKCLRKRPGHTVLSLGDAIRIQVADVSINEHQIQFAPAPE